MRYSGKRYVSVKRQSRELYILRSDMIYRVRKLISQNFYFLVTCIQFVRIYSIQIEGIVKLYRPQFLFHIALVVLVLCALRDYISFEIN